MCTYNVWKGKKYALQNIVIFTNVLILTRIIIKIDGEWLYICDIYSPELAPLDGIARVIGPWYIIIIDPMSFALACSLVTSGEEGGGWASWLSSVVVIVLLVLHPKLASFAWLTSCSTIGDRKSGRSGIQGILGCSVDVSHRVIIGDGVSPSDWVTANSRRSVSPVIFWVRPVL